jgi:hypothetical protein
MQTIYLDPVLMTPRVLAFLEKKKLVRRLLPTAKLLQTRTRTGTVDTFYCSSEEHGAHKLIGIGKRSTEIKLGFHPDNEEFILINPTQRTFKPLYLIIALQKHQVFERRAARGQLTVGDLLAVECTFNDPRTCVFTLLEGTVHCEVTEPGGKQHPVFFVSEPSRLKSARCATPGVRFAVQYSRKRKQ